MNRPKFIFIGPTLSYADLCNLKLPTECRKIHNLSYLDNQENFENALYVLPPASGGDFYTLSQKCQNFDLILIDGFFENTVSVWHKEILYLLKSGIPVYGASSMGALRASELSYYGMIGYGKIYECYANGDYEDDDEVTVVHGPQDLGYPSLSVAMANIRATIQKALAESIIDTEFSERFLRIAKKLFYKERNYARIRDILTQDLESQDEVLNFMSWISANSVDQKSSDCQSLLLHIYENPDKIDRKQNFEFEDSSIWRHFIGQ